MTPRERAIAALTMQTPDEVPTFELEFQISQEMFGIDIQPEDLLRKNIGKLSAGEKERRLCELAEDIVKVYDQLDYAIIPGPYGVGWVEGVNVSAEKRVLHREIIKLAGHERMIGYHGDGTFAIPDGNEMYGFIYAISDDPASVHARARHMAEEAIERNKRLAESGVEVLLLCSDYCYNTGPFLSPAMFSEFIQPYLAQIIDAARREGLYTIKHTDGNIMPILDQLVACRPHAIHSLDPMAGVDIRKVKQLAGGQVCLCGNVNCSLLQSGTEDDLRNSAQYALEHGKPGGGYIYCTSNVPFKGVEPRRYQIVLDEWKKGRVYPPPDC
jgi:uroporphyrinogen decarboxylase